MKTTGIIRRVDELGRVVIPKEMRRVLGIQEGDPLEIAVENGEIAMRKYSFESEAAKAAKLVYALTDEMPPDLAKRIRAMVEPIIDTLTEEVK